MLDLNLAGMDGVAVCERIRTFSSAYVVMLSARSQETDKLIAPSIRADDYLTKPFSPRELVARVRTLLRRPRGTVDQAPETPTRRRVGPLEIDPDAHQVWCDGVEHVLGCLHCVALRTHDRPWPTRPRASRSSSRW